MNQCELRLYLMEIVYGFFLSALTLCFLWVLCFPPTSQKHSSWWTGQNKLPLVGSCGYEFLFAWCSYLRPSFPLIGSKPAMTLRVHE